MAGQTRQQCQRYREQEQVGEALVVPTECLLGQQLEWGRENEGPWQVRVVVEGGAELVKPHSAIGVWV